METYVKSHLLTLLVLSLGACAPKVDEVLPDVPDNTQEEQTPAVFDGLWVSSCNEESFESFKSQRTEYLFQDETLSIHTSYFLEDECFAEADFKETEGQYKLSNGKNEGNNLISFNENLEGGGAVKKYIRTMSIDGQFIITSPQFSQQNASSAVADIPLYRQDEWQKIEEKLYSKLPKSSVLIDSVFYHWDQDSSCELEVVTGKPSELTQRVYLQPNQRCNSLELQFICEREKDSCEASDSSSTNWKLIQTSATKFDLLKISSNEKFSFQAIKK